MLGISRSILISRPVSRSAIYDLDLVLDLEGFGLDLDFDLGAFDLGIFSRDQLEIVIILRYYVKYHTKKLSPIGENATPWNGYTPGIHMDCVLVFSYPFLIFALAPVFTLPH